jgi:hypothetical protein
MNRTDAARKTAEYHNEEVTETHGEPVGGYAVLLQMSSFKMKAAIVSVP